MPDSSPIWDLTDLYSTIEDAAIATDIEASRKAAKSLAADWRGRLGEADGPQLAQDAHLGRLLYVYDLVLRCIVSGGGGDGRAGRRFQRYRCRCSHDALAAA